MADAVKGGWYADPEHRHEWRWFSQGAPTDLELIYGRYSVHVVNTASDDPYKPGD